MFAGEWAGAAAVAGAIAAMLASTRQIGARWRLGALALALVFLLIAWRAAGERLDIGALTVAAEIAAHWRTPEDSVFLQALAANAAAAERHAPALLATLTLTATAMAPVCLLALRPGEKIERFARLALAALLGAMAGAGLALGLVAIGFGAAVRPRDYITILAPKDVIDGDTVRIGEVSVRLAGLDAPELSEDCRLHDYVCGETARAALVRLAAGRLVRCTPPEGSRIVYSFGRPVLRCEASLDVAGPWIDLTAAMIAEGQGQPWRRDRDPR